MRIRSLVLLLLAVVAACEEEGGNDDGDGGSFETLSECIVVNDAGGVAQAIFICCSNHAIGPDPAGEVCGSSIEFCRNFVNAELDPPPSPADVESGCQMYIDGN